MEDLHLSFLYLIDASFSLTLFALLPNSAKGLYYTERACQVGISLCVCAEGASVSFRPNSSSFKTLVELFTQSQQKCSSSQHRGLTMASNIAERIEIKLSLIALVLFSLLFIWTQCKIGVLHGEYYSTEYFYEDMAQGPLFALALYVVFSTHLAILALLVFMFHLLCSKHVGPAKVFTLPFVACVVHWAMLSKCFPGVPLPAFLFFKACSFYMAMTAAVISCVLVLRAEKAKYDKLHSNELSCEL